MTCRLASELLRAACAAALLLASTPALALDDVPDEDEAPAPAPSAPAPSPVEPAIPAPAEPAAPTEPAEVELPPADDAAPAAASERPVSGYWHGRSRLQLVAG